MKFDTKLLAKITTTILTIIKSYSYADRKFMFKWSKATFRIEFTPYNRLSGQQMLSGIQIIFTSHGMTGRNFFDVFLPFYLLFGF
jgi:hypothetical protein